jgi:hypothetical protein
MVLEWLRRPDSNRRYAAYETAALPLGYSAVFWKWMARRPGAAPDKRGFGDLAALLAHVAFVENEIRPAGIAPASPGWHPGILLLNDGRNVFLNQ